MNQSYRINASGFAEDIETLRASLYSTLSPHDFTHLKKIERWGRLSTLVGYLTVWMAVNPLTAFALSLGQFTRWLLAHHILHKGYDRVPGVPERYTSKGFAKGWRRWIDWFDWIEPRAWDYEHNILHHYHTGEDADPDLVEKHVAFLQRLRVPRALKYLSVALAAMTWKFTYYAPNTTSVMAPDGSKRIPKGHIVFITIRNVLDFSKPHVRALWLKSYLPYSLLHFCVIPVLFLPFGMPTVWIVLANKALAEIFTNVHSFLVIGPNHTADDLYRFDFHYKDKKEFYVTQVLGSANYRCGNELVDYLSIWLNYQIEHHLFPDLPMTKYREAQPQVKALCEKHGLPYRQEPMLKRFRRMVSVCVGRSSLRPLERFEDIGLQTTSPLPVFAPSNHAERDKPRATGDVQPS